MRRLRHLLTLEEELERQRGLVAMYAEALEAMTKSRDLYREAAERPMRPWPPTRVRRGSCAAAVPHSRLRCDSRHVANA
ncbi:hypothetical protein SAFG77S_11868 [Streptomyces afghaniensis]